LADGGFDPTMVRPMLRLEKLGGTGVWSISFAASIEPGSVSVRSDALATPTSCGVHGQHDGHDGAY
jgi:hypothetical protein